MKNHVLSYEKYIKESMGDIEFRNRDFCVIWTVQIGDDEFQDHSEFYATDKEHEAKAHYDHLLTLDDTYCASLCKVILDTDS